MNGVNAVNGNVFERLRESTAEKIEYIMAEGYKVVELWECEWYEMIKQDKTLKKFVKDHQRPCDWKINMTEEQILHSVVHDKIFGALEVDIRVPDHLKAKFAEMPPIFKNTAISREDIGEEHDVMA